MGSLELLWTTVRFLWQQADVPKLSQQSFRNFHSVGVDYFCLYRTSDLTVKLYSFDKEFVGNVVNPHSHRYNFQTYVLSGSLHNVEYHEIPKNVFPDDIPPREDWFRHEYRTPLAYEAGTGLSPGEKVQMAETKSPVMKPGDGYYLYHHEVHTLRVPEPTLLLLYQYRDWVKPYTLLYTKDGKAPDMTALYQPFSEEEYLNQLTAIMRRAKI